MHVQLRAPIRVNHEPLIRSAIEPMPGVREVSVNGHRLSARADDGAAVAPAVLAALEQAGVAAATVTVARPSLDDVYLRYAGRRFADADAAQDAVSTMAGGAR